ncbi:MAG TPA: N-acetylmuramic acid 6-phosphate etherase [Armatimonadetes bacterium]|nr:N-acetylmuramic acid 6-phosphate etherase [Armatimonadota bacterium]
MGCERSGPGSPWEGLRSERAHPKASNIEEWSLPEILRFINEEDKRVPLAVERELPNIERAAAVILDRLGRGGRLFYVGAGTSGRLGVLDAVELPPTFGTSPEMVQGIIAGGKEAMFRAREGREDDESAGRREITRRGVGPKDVVFGLSVAGTARFVIGALKRAKELGATTIAFTCNPGSEITAHADVVICPDVGPEVIAGSTRMKGGTAEKLVLNMISTAVMIKLGRVEKGLMANLRAWSRKLRERAIRIVQSLAGCSREEAEEALEVCNWEVRVAALVVAAKVDKEVAKEALERNGWNFKGALHSLVERGEGHA